MRIERIDVENFQGIAAFSATLSAPVTLICGPNRAGKSTIRDAVELALTGKPRRVDTKKDLSKLVHDGASTGSIRLKFAGTQLACFAVPSGAWTENVLHGRDPAQIAIALDGQRFAALKPDERRRFLFAVTGVSTDAKDVAQRMRAMGLDERRVGEIAGMLHAGFEAAEAEARGTAKAAKQAWRITAGEPYGEKKAADWRAPGGGMFDPAEYEKLELDLAASRNELGLKQQAIGAWSAQRQAYETAAETRNKLKARADVLPVARENAARAGDELKTQREGVERLRALAQGASAESVPCPHCGGGLRIVGGQPVAADAPASPEAQDASNRLPEHVQALSMLERALASRQRALGEAESAAGELGAFKMPDTPGDAPPSADGIRARIRELEQQRETMARQRDAANTAAAKTEQAAKHHEDVLAWTRIADALAPDGLPAQLLTEALEPIRDIARKAARFAKWPEPAIGVDMLVRADGREYALLSESEQWRVDACLAVAFAAQIPTGLLLLDRFDVLDIPSRGQAVTMLRNVQRAFALDTVLVFGTLKQPPTGLPEGMASVWLDAPARALQAAA